MPLTKLKTYLKLFKLANVKNEINDVQLFYRNHAISVFEKEGWFDFLAIPRTVNEIIDNYNITSIDFLNDVLDTLLSDRIIEQFSNGKYQARTELEVEPIKPRFLTESLIDLWQHYGNFIPQRLQGKYLPFTAEFSLFNWDDGLAAFLYQQIRNLILTYVDVLKKPGKLVDIGCGNGIGTADIWARHFDKKLFFPGSKAQIYGMEIDTNLLSIAEEEFLHMAQKFTNKSRDKILDYKDYFPQFYKGSAINTSFKDEEFDYVYISAVLHWTNPQMALHELYRILKPGGILFGSQVFYPTANKWMNLYMKVCEGANGFFYQKDMTNWAKNAKFRKMEYITPITVFKFTK